MIFWIFYFIPFLFLFLHFFEFFVCVLVKSLLEKKNLDCISIIKLQFANANYYMQSQIPIEKLISNYFSYSNLHFEMVEHYSLVEEKPNLNSQILQKQQREISNFS